MTLGQLVALYKQRAGGYGRPLLLSELGLAKEELERELSAFEEDYQISRFFQLTRAPGETRLYTISGFPYTHLALLPEIETIL
ncbi:MAG: hypothetical protein ACE5HB_04695 [Terriglobia bacterium]